MKSHWLCPNCSMSSSRQWNVRRHIEKCHGNLSMPVNGYTKFNEASYSSSNSRSTYFNNHDTAFDPVTYFQSRVHRELDHTKFLDKVNTDLRKYVDFKNLLNQLLIPATSPSTGYYSSNTNTNLTNRQNSKPVDLEI